VKAPAASYREAPTLSSFSPAGGTAGVASSACRGNPANGGADAPAVAPSNESHLPDGRSKKTTFLAKAVVGFSTDRHKGPVARNSARKAEKEVGAKPYGGLHPL